MAYCAWTLFTDLNTRNPDRVFEKPGPGFLGPNTRDFVDRVTRTCNPFSQSYYHELSEKPRGRLNALRRTRMYSTLEWTRIGSSYVRGIRSSSSNLSTGKHSNSFHRASFQVLKVIRRLRRPLLKDFSDGIIGRMKQKPIGHFLGKIWS